jgi:uncharacterized Zn-binding protein involved in type VI secretion
MSLNGEQLFALLPAVYRNRDGDIGDPLQSLYAVLAQQLGIVEDNIQQLYDDQFIETCERWVIPYIGDLIGYNSIYELAATSDSRAEVANTIGYRRRKGTLLALEQVAADVSGRTVVAVEEFRRLITTESMRIVRPRHASTLNLRRTSALDRLNTAFDPASRTIDVRRIAPRFRIAPDPDPAPLDIGLHGPGRSNITDIAIHLWRLKARPVVNAPAFPVGAGRFMFSPFGANMPLFSQPPARASFSGLSTRLDVPEPIDRTEFDRGLRHSRSPQFYGASESILLVADGVAVPASQIVCANLSDLAPGGPWCTVPAGRIAIDPELGRIAFARDLPLPQSLRLNYSFGTAAEIGGGPYDRTASLISLKPAQATFFSVIGTTSPTLESAIAAWNALVAVTPNSTGIIVFPGFERFAINLTGTAAIQLPAGSQLALVSGQPVPSGGPFDIIWNHSCVTLSGNIEVAASTVPIQSAGTGPAFGQLLVSGLWIAGQLSVSGGVASIQILDSTLVPGLALTSVGDPVSPGDPSIRVTAVEVSLTVLRSITGPIVADPGGSTRVCSSIVDATSSCCVGYAAADLASAGADLHIEDSTVIGKVHTRTMQLASNTIFFARRPRRDPWPAAIWVSRRQTGCVRFCWLPFESITPRRYLCIPPGAASEAALTPKFVSLRFGRPGYALLSGDVPLAIWHGADNGSQIGVYYQIQETEAVRNVQLRAPEYLPVALESGIFLHPSHPDWRETRPPSVVYGRLVPPPQCCDDTDSDRPSFYGIGTALV